MLVLVTGNTTLATSTILASFMAGLSIGSYYWGKHIESRPGRSLFFFGCLETCIGTSALFISYIIKFVTPLEMWISQTTDLGYYTQIIRFFLCFGVLIVPTFFMGGTFAVIGRHVISKEHNFGRDTAVLYGLNTAGALIGTFLTGFFMIKAFGHNGCLAFAVALNLSVGAIAILTDLRIQRRGTDPDIAEKKQRATGMAHFQPSRTVANLILIGLGLSGFCGMAYQVLWTRLLILIIDNSVYSFSIILMAFLAGISLGSLMIAPVFRILKNPVIVFGLLEIGIAISAFFFPFFINHKTKGPNESYLSFLFFTVPLGMLLPTVLMGMAFPIAAQIYQSRKNAVGRSLGTVFAMNTAGSVLGVLAACFFFIAYLGFQKSAVILPVLNMALGVIILVSQLRPKPRYAMTGTMILLTVTGIQAMPPDYFFSKYAELEPKSNLIFFKESIATTATIFERPDNSRALYLNGIPEVDTGRLSMKTFKLMGALPGLIHKNPENALMITFGAGIASGTTSHFVNRIDCVDLADQALEIAKYFSFANDKIYENKKFFLQIDDARHFLKNARKQYSIIISDATHPRVYDSWVLFTQEFYRLVKNRLEDDGIFLQWVPFHGLELKQYLGIVNTFSNVFEHTSIWNVGRGYSLLLSTPETLRIDFHAFQQKLFQKEIRESMGRGGLNNPFEILAYFAMGEKKIKELTASFPMIMTDDSPAHLFFPFRTTFRDQYKKWPEVNYRSLLSHEESIIPFLVNIDASQRKRERIIDKIRYYERKIR